MLETYNLTVKFSDEEREKYMSWGLKIAKCLSISSVIFMIVYVLFTVYKYICIFRLVFNRSLSDLEYQFVIFALRGESFSFIVFYYDFILFLLLFFVVKVFDFIEKLIFPCPVIQKRVEVTLDSFRNVIMLKLYEDKRELASEVIDLYSFKNIINVNDNSIIVNGCKYIIGLNKREDIYVGMKTYFYFEEPKQYKSAINSVEKLDCVVDGLIASLNEKKREDEWLKNNGGK